MKIILLCLVLGVTLGQEAPSNLELLKSTAGFVKNTGKVLGLQAQRLFNAKKDTLIDILTPSDATKALFANAPSLGNILDAKIDVTKQLGKVLALQTQRILMERPELKYIIPAVALGGAAASRIPYDKVKNTISNGYESTKNKIGRTYNAAKNKVSDAYQQKKTRFYPLFKKATSSVYNGGKNAIGGLYNVGKEAVGGIYRVKKDSVQGISNVANDAYESRNVLINDLRTGVKAASQDVFRGTRTLAKDTSIGVNGVLEDLSKKNQAIGNFLLRNN